MTKCDWCHRFPSLNHTHLLGSTFDCSNPSHFSWHHLILQIDISNVIAMPQTLYSPHQLYLFLKLKASSNVTCSLLYPLVVVCYCILALTYSFHLLIHFITFNEIIVSLTGRNWRSWRWGITFSIELQSALSSQRMTTWSHSIIYPLIDYFQSCRPAAS